LIGRSAALTTFGWLGIALGTAMASSGEDPAAAHGQMTETESRVDAGAGLQESMPPDPVRSELKDACVALRTGGFEGAYMFRRANHGQHYRCEPSGSLRPIRAREFRRARCRCPRGE